MFWKATIRKFDIYCFKQFSTIIINYTIFLYIFTTNSNVIVLTKEYKEVLKEDINKLAKNTNNYELIYRTNKLMYEDTTVKDNKVTYDYYDANTYKKISSTTLEQ